MSEKRIAFISGATSGIGKATAELLAQNIFKLIITGRRKDRLEELSNTLSNQTEVYTTSFDIRDKEAVFKAIQELPEEWKQVDVLINNAGNAHGLGPIHEGNVEDWDAMIDINVKGLLYLTKAITPSMIERKSGHVVNIGSIAGKEVYPNGNVYCASKHAVDAINNGMRMDFNPFGIKVTAINPGLVETEFSLVRFKGDEKRADNVYKGFDALQAADIADTILYVVTRPAHVNISDMVVFPTAQAASTMVHKNN
ncbi:SDR family NAD(P)-dependent oxidoreductase [Fulvivirga sp.]|uniref:SDR family NAD(P)-dependent oxidoreductase n=1 Tax=Fulvivirga sp. TaxID=1931237 RepID=UPI0032EE7007